jgi:phosphonopyruvate decarboxylase
MIECENFYDLLSKESINFFCGVPDSLLKNFNTYIRDNVPEEKHIITSNEGGAIALAAGYHLATGKIPLVYLQNAGQGNIINPLTSLIDKEVYKIPILLLIGWRGEPGTKDEPQHKKQGNITLDLLDILGIPYSILSDDLDELKQSLKEAKKYMDEKNLPYAFVVKKGTFKEYKSFSDNKEDYELNLEEALNIIMKEIEKESIIISTTGKISRELFEYREKLKQSHKRDFLNIGAMGHSSQIALGIALEKSKKRVYCFEGDGSLIMHMGSLAIIGQISPKNLIHIIFNNESHDSVGGPPTAGGIINIAKIAENCGYRIAFRAKTKEELLEKLNKIKNNEGPSLLEIKIRKGTKNNLGRPTKTTLESKKEFMDFLSKN